MLDRRHPTGVERAAVAGPLDLQFDVGAVLTAAHEVEVQRLRQLPGLDGGARGPSDCAAISPPNSLSLGPLVGLRSEEHVTVSAEVQ